VLEHKRIVKYKFALQDDYEVGLSSKYNNFLFILKLPGVFAVIHFNKIFAI